MGKSKSALPDLTKVIELKPDFTAVSFKECQQFMEINYSLFIHSFICLHHHHHHHDAILTLLSL